MNKSQLFVILGILIVIGILLRFYNLNWSSPFYFHPDERNIASAVTQLTFPHQMNPHFFAYGSFPIYAIYFTGTLWNTLSHASNPLNVPFEQAIVISRFFSSLFSVLLIPLMYAAGLKIKGQKAGIVTAILVTFSTGLIQYAHFGTFEMWLTFFTALHFYCCLHIIKDKKLTDIIFIGIITGILIAIKISSIPFISLTVFSLAVAFLKRHAPNRKKYVAFVLLFFLIAISIFSLTSPFVFLDQNSFINTIRYEGSVALGTIPVFYTGEFYGTIPILFQFINIYPFIVNPLITIIFIPSFIYAFFSAIKTKNSFYFLLIACYLLLFISQAFLFTKWIRYIIPTLPAIYLVIAIAITDFFKYGKALRIKYAVTCAILLICILHASAFVMTNYQNQDTRIAASIFAKNNISKDTKIVSEIYDMGIVAFNPYFPNITLFHFYELDDPRLRKTKQEELSLLLQQSNYIILPSQRLLKTRLINKKMFPQGYSFYSKLIDGSLGFNKIYQTPCDILCKIVYLGDPSFSFEQTSNVFDRPTVFIFKKM